MSVKNEEILIFTDGASKGNPGPGGWGTIIAFSDDSRINADETRIDAEIVELGGREEHTTNNRMELTAAINALQKIRNPKSLPAPQTRQAGEIRIFSDSSYLINGITKWVHGWEKNSWMTKEKKQVENRDLWETLHALVKSKDIEWKYIGGHSGIVGNERCDEIATQFADSTQMKGKSRINADTGLYKGPLSGYPIKNILDLKNTGKLSGKKRSKAKAYSYVSAVDGKIETHKTWEECEKRVKGKRGARFKKALSEIEEEEIMKELAR